MSEEIRQVDEVISEEGETELKNGQHQKKKKKKKPFPSSTFENALILANAIQEFASGQKVRRITLFDHLNRTPDSGPSRQLVINSERYGLTKGGNNSEYLELTSDGYLATSPEVPLKSKIEARFRLAIQNIEPFRLIYEQYKNVKLPSRQVIMDFLLEAGFDKDLVSECIDIFLINSKYIGLLKVIAGAERLLTIEHILEELNEEDFVSNSSSRPKDSFVQVTSTNEQNTKKNNNDDYFDKICFYISPIGEEGSELRQHADLFLNYLVEPAVKEFGLEVIRADKISDPGIITSQIIEHIIKSKLVIADLSYHNPNVFYELSIRHTFKLPCVQIIRKADRIPFDLDQVRTIKIDTSSIYTLVPQLELYRAEISEQVRRSLENPEAVDNPITAYSKSITVSF